MFDHYDIRHSTSSPSRIDVHEHRAPTPDSARFLNELQREAEKRIFASVPLENNLLKGQVFLHHYYAIHGYQLVAIYEINGKQFQSTVDRSGYKLRTVEDQVEFVHELRDKIAKDIAGILLDANLNHRLFDNGPTANL